METADLMKRALLSIIVVITLLSPSAYAYDVLVVQSLRVRPHDEAVKNIKTAVSSDVQVIFSSDLSRSDVIREVREKRPDVIVAVGTDALSKVGKIRDIPIVYLMVLHPEPLTGDSDNVTGISMIVSPEKQLSSFQRVMPQTRKIGIIYDAQNSAPFVRKAMAAAKPLDVELVVREVSSSRDVPTMLNSLKGKLQALWIIPDATVINKATFDFLLLFSLENKIPIFTFSSQYVEMGAFVSVDLDPHHAGKQAGEVVNRLLDGTRVSEIPTADAKNGVVTINMKVARKLGLDVNEGALATSRVVR